MARGRMLSTYVALSETMADLPDDTCRLVATWMIPHLDRDGRITGSPRRLKAIVVPLLNHIEVEDVKRCVEAICAGPDPLAVLYRDTTGLPVIEFKTFASFQFGLKYDRETPSRFGPPPDSSGAPPDSSCIPPDSSASRARAGALTSLPFSSLPGSGSDARDPRAPAPTPGPDPSPSVQTAPPDTGTAAALVAIWPELRADIEGQLSVWADAHRGVDFVQLAKEAKAKSRAQRRSVDNVAAYLTGWFQRASNERRASKSAEFEADHKKRKAAEAEEARLSKQLAGPPDAKPIQVGALLAALTKGTGHE